MSQWFKYSAFDAQGRRDKGVVQAASAEEAERILEQRQLMVATVAPGKAPRRPASGPAPDVSETPASRGRGLNREIRIPGIPRPVASRDRIRFLRDLALLLRSGVPLLSALDLIGSRAGHPKVEKASRHAIRAISDGESLSRAFSGFPGLVPHGVCRLIESAETTGRVDRALVRGAEFIERSAKYRQAILTSLFYPCFVLLAALGVSYFLVTGVIPKIAAFVAKRGRGLPPLTQAMVDVSVWLENNGLYLFGGLVVALLALVAFYRWPRGRKTVDRLLVATPVAKSVIISGEMSQLGWSLSMMLDSGVSISDGLAICARSSLNQAVSQRLEDARDRLVAGASLADSLRDPVIPAMFVEIVAVGEQSGTLSGVLAESGAYYGDRLQAVIRRLAALVEPATILVVGSIVGIVYYAFFQALVAIAG